MPASRNKVIYGIGCSLETFVKHHGSSYMLHVLSRNVVRFVLKPGPFCPGTLTRGPNCPETWSVLSGPFCPWSV